MWYTYTMEYFLVIKKNEITSPAGNTDEYGDCHTEWSKRKTNIIWYCYYVESKKDGTNEVIYKTETESQM